jgi:hypothetical protein
MSNFKRMIIPCCVLIGAGIAPALADCSNRSLSGDYASRTQGSVIGVFDSSGALHPLATPQVVSGVGQTTFDGNGSFVRSDVGVNSGVVLGSPTPLTDTGFRTGQSGTYQIDADCTGTLSLMVPGGLEIDFAIVLSNDGRTMTGTVVKEHVPALPPAIVPAGTSCDAGTGCSVGVNLLIDFTQVSSRRR